MKVIYEPPIMDRIRAAKRAAQMEDRTINHIELAWSEWNELVVWLCTHSMTQPIPTKECKAYGITCRRAEPQ